MQDSPQEVKLTPSSDTPTQDAAGFDRIGMDLGNVISSLQNSVEQMRSAAQTEINRLRGEHEEERTRLQGEIEQLRTRCSGQDERIRNLQSQLTSVLEDYRGELEMQTQRAEAARGQLDRLRQLMSALESTGSESEGVPSAHSFAPVQGTIREVPYQAQRRGRVVESWQPESSPNAAHADDHTVQIGPQSEATATKKISVRGVSAVSAMMRARKAVESLPGIKDVESRYVSDGTLYFSVRSDEDSETLAKALTSLPDPNLRALQVSDDSIELEM